MSNNRCGWWLSFVLSLSLVVPLHAAPLELAGAGQARMQVVVTADASPALRQAARELAEMLGKLSGATFALSTSAGEQVAAPAIRLGVVGQWRTPAGAVGADQLDSQDPRRREEYLLRTDAHGLWLIGATEQAAPHAVWDVLYRLGHRQYLPGSRWEIVPTHTTLQLDLDEVQRPSFLDRTIWPGGGYFDYDKEPVLQWQRRNRLGRGFHLATGHIYDRIVHEQQKLFDEHPEYLALIKGARVPRQREGNKFCISNPDLRALVIDWAKGWFTRYPHTDGVPMEPSDGGGWCECDACAAMGSPSDRAYTLASQVAQAVNTDAAAPRFVAILAYGEHSPPPRVQVDPRVVVTVANGYLRGGYRFEELLKMWGERGHMLGTYEYLGVVQWSWDRPGTGRATRRSYARQTLPLLRDAGVRLFVGEAEGNWGPAGFGYFNVARCLWDVDATAQTDALFTQFITDCFPDCAAPMRAFYDLIDGDNRPLMSRDLVGRMYRHLDDAWRLTSDDAVRARLTDLLIYTRYVELYQDYTTADGEARQAAFETFMRFVLRIRSYLMVHSREIHRQLHRIDRRVTQPDEVSYRVKITENPWYDATPVSAAEVQQWTREGIANNPLFNFTPRTYSLDLTPATPLKLTAPIELGAFGGGTQNRQQFYVWVASPAQPLELTVTGGLIKHYRDRGDVRIGLYPASEADDTLLDEARVPPDGEPRQVKLTAREAGLHRIDLSDGGDRTNVLWEPGLPLTFISDAGATISYPLAWTLCFYVPRGTQRVAGYCGHPSGKVIDGAGQERFNFTSMSGAGFFDIPVSAGQDGQVWAFVKCSGARRLLTVPPSLARSVDELLLPREVVEADMPR